MTGIVDLEYEFPTAAMSVPQMHRSSGLSEAEIQARTICSEIPVFGPSEPAWPLISRVAARVLERSRVAPAEIGQVILAGSGDWDHPAWSPAAKVAAELGVSQAHCFEVVNFCNAAGVAIQIAADTVAAGRVGHALVLLGEQASRGIDYRDPDSVDLFNTGDCAVAMLLAETDAAFELLLSRSRTDPSLSDYYVGEHEEGRAVTRRRARRLKLPLTYLRNYEALITEVVTALEMTPQQISYLLVNQVDRRIHERLLSTLGLPAEKSVFNYSRFGHMGCADTFIALADLRSEHRLKDGDVVLQATSGAGFSWGVTALRYRVR